MMDVVVLAGGQSRRMGQDKAAMIVDGTRQIDRVLQSLGDVEGRVIVARGDLPTLGLGPRVVEVADDPGLGGPLAGLVAAVGQLHADVAAVVAVDMPRISTTLLELLAGLVRRERRAAAAPVVDGVPQPMHAVIATSALPALVWRARRGESSLRRALGSIDAMLVGPEAWRDLDDGTFATDWDRPEDLLPPQR